VPHHHARHVAAVAPAPGGRQVATAEAAGSATDQ
jgi:hypothetical protein